MWWWESASMPTPRISREEIHATATSLALELGHPVHRASIINGVMCAFEEYYGIYRETLDMSRLKEAYNQELVNVEREVKVLAPGGDYRDLPRNQRRRRADRGTCGWQPAGSQFRGSVSKRNLWICMTQNSCMTA